MSGNWIVISNSSGTGFSGASGAADSYPESNGSAPPWNEAAGVSGSPFLLIQEYS